MSATMPIVSGHTGFSSTSLQLIRATERLVEEVVNFRARPRDFSAPRMQLASSLPAQPLAEMGQQIDITA